MCGRNNINHTFEQATKEANAGVAMERVAWSTFHPHGAAVKLNNIAADFIAEGQFHHAIATLVDATTALYSASSNCEVLPQQVECLEAVAKALARRSAASKQHALTAPPGSPQHNEQKEGTLVAVIVDPSVFARPLRLSPQECFVASDPEHDSAVVLYNAALAHQLLGMRIGMHTSFEKAMGLYELSSALITEMSQLQDWQGSPLQGFGTTALLVAATLNNMGRIHALQGEHAFAKDHAVALLSIIDGSTRGNDIGEQSLLLEAEECWDELMLILVVGYDYAAPAA